eukprot:gene24818-10961_t
MWPPLLMLDPGCAKSALQYRYDKRGGAHDRTLACNPNTAPSAEHPYGTPYCTASYTPPKEGLMFPWESACTGMDVQNTHGVCGPWCRLEQHVSGDVAFAVQQYYYATGDADWLRSTGWPLVNGVAQFYAARVEESGAGTGTYEYLGVMGPDEYSWPVNNSVYTNNVVRTTLTFASEAAKVLGFEVPEKWAEIVAGIVIPFAETVPGHPTLKGGYHPEFSGFAPSPRGVKQADTVMLSFPFMAEMPTAVLANDLQYYTDVTSQGGPAMTWAIFAIDWMQAALQPGTSHYGNFSQAVHFFKKGYANVKLPFNVWTETPSGGAVNFLTGAGGFLQSALFGSSGMRLTKNGLTFDPPPPSASGGMATMMGIRAINYHGNQISRQVRENTVTTLLVKAGSGSAAALVLTDATTGETTPLQVGVPITTARGKATIQLKTRI